MFLWVAPSWHVPRLMGALHLAEMVQGKDEGEGQQPGPFRSGETWQFLGACYGDSIASSNHDHCCEGSQLSSLWSTVEL